MPSYKNTALVSRVEAAQNKLGKWRNVYVSWLLGTRLKTDHDVRYRKDVRELLLLLRAEVSAQTKLLSELGVTDDRLLTVYAEEYEALDKALEGQFPGFTTSEYGVEINAKVALETMRRYGFPP